MLRLSSVTKDRGFLEPIPRALAYLRRSILADGQLAWYYELRTNRPLYMERTGKVYSLTYDDSRLPGHSGRKTKSRLQELARKYSARMSQQKTAVKTSTTPTAADVRRVISALDDQGRWVSTFDGGLHVGQLNLPIGTKYLSSSVFSHNLKVLSKYVQQHK